MVNTHKDHFALRLKAGKIRKRIIEIIKHYAITKENIAVIAEEMLQ